jgi:hypothetical protein
MPATLSGTFVYWVGKSRTSRLGASHAAPVTFEIDIDSIRILEFATSFQ